MRASSNDSCSAFPFEMPVSMPQTKSIENSPFPHPPNSLFRSTVYRWTYFSLPLSIINSFLFPKRTYLLPCVFRLDPIHEWYRRWQNCRGCGEKTVLFANFQADYHGASSGGGRKKWRAHLGDNTFIDFFTEVGGNEVKFRREVDLWVGIRTIL